MTETMVDMTIPEAKITGPDPNEYNKLGYLLECEGETYAGKIGTWRNIETGRQPTDEVKEAGRCAMFLYLREHGEREH